MSLMLFSVYVFSIIGIFLIATITAMGSIEKKKYYFVAASYLTAAWMSLQCIVQSYQMDSYTGLKLMQLASSLALGMSILFYLFVRFYINKTVSIINRAILFVVFIAGFIANMSNLMILEISVDQIGINVIESTVLYSFYIYLIGIFFLVAVVELFLSTIRMKSKKIKTRNRLMFIGVAQATILIILSNVIDSSSFFNLELITPLSLFVMSIFMGLSIIKYRFFDIKTAVLRTFTYAISLMTLSAIYYVLAYLLSVSLFKNDISSSLSVSPVNIALALLLAFIFQPIRKFFDRITDKIFYKDNYNTDDFYARLNKTLTMTTDLRSLLERTSNDIADTLKCEQVFFFINTSSEHYISAGTPGHKHIPKSDTVLFERCQKTKEGIIASVYIENDESLRRLMVSHKIKLVLPLKQSGQVLGYLCLGNHRNSGYTIRDMKVLSTISDELVIAIQNALSIQEVKDLNENLQMRINEATRELRASNAQLQRLDKAKDEFVSMASHQLRTPLTSIKGYVSMILDGDVGEINDTMRHMLDEAFMSSERMVHLINDFLNMSRIQTGKFMIDKTSIDLSKVVRQEIDSLQPSAIAHDLRFEYKQPTDFPLINVDEGKIRQVIMNFADNAIYYSKPNSRIDIILESDRDMITFKVKDHGIGVPESEKANLFTKFFRAANAKKQRPDGTGVGLYLAKRIVDAHNGKIVFESVEGQGSTFGFSIPIKQG